MSIKLVFLYLDNKFYVPKCKYTWKNMKKNIEVLQTFPKVVFCKVRAAYLNLC